MEIGGFDNHYDFESSHPAKKVFGVVKEVWPNARMEKIAWEEGRVTEFFVYRSAVVYRSICRLGLEDFHQKHFVHFILEPEHNRSTLVIGEHNNETQEIDRLLKERLNWKKAEAAS